MSFAHGKLTRAAATATYTITFAKPSQFAGETFAAVADRAGTAITLAAAAMAFLPSPTIAAPNFFPISH
jgi:hypothetical protein